MCPGREIISAEKGENTVSDAQQTVRQGRVTRVTSRLDIII